MGCGRVGAALATELDEGGHEVVVIDRDPAAFARLAEQFDGRTVTALTLFGECRVPGGSTLVQADDLIHLAVPSGVVDDLDDILERGPSDD